MIEVFDVNEFLMSENSYFENHNSINRRLISKIMQLSSLCNFTKIKSNSKIISELADSSAYHYNMINTNINYNNSLILYGILMGRIQIYIDSNQNWDDDKIYPIYDPLIIRTYKINKIKKNNININILDYLEIKNLLI